MPDARSLALPFLEPEFLETYAEFVAPVRGERLETIEAGAGSADVVVRSVAGLRVAELAGKGFADYMDVRYENRSGAIEVIDALVDSRRWDAIILRNIPDSSATLPLAVSRANERDWLAWSMPGQVAPFVDVAGNDWEAYQQSRGDRKSRYNRRRATRKLVEAGARFEHYTCAHDIDRALPDAFALYGARARGVSSSWRFSGSKGRPFFQALAERFARRGMFDLAILRVGVPVAFACCLHHADVTYYYQVGISADPAVARFSPGGVLLEHLLARAFEQERTRFDFMLGDEPYKAAWASGAMSVGSLLLARREARSRVSFAYTRLAAATRERARQSSGLRRTIEQLSRVRARVTREQP